MTTSTVTISEKTAWTKGAYTAWLAPWGAGSLKYGQDYTDSLTVSPDSFPNGVTINWSWPTNSNSYGIRNFDAIDFGNYNGTTPQTPIASMQVKNIGTLTQTQSLVLGGNGSNFDVLTDMFLTSKAGDSNTKVAEIEILLHTPNFSKDWVNSLTQIGTFTGSGHTWKVAISKGSVPDIIFMPSDSSDVLSGSVDIKAMLNYLVAHGTITGNEYFNGLAMGAEVNQGTGSLAISNFAVTYSAQATASVPASSTTQAGSTTAPTTTLTDALQSTSNGVTTTVIKGHTDPGSVVTLSDYGTVLSNKIVADSHGDWSYSTTKISPGLIHDLTASAIGQNGKVGAVSNDLQLGTPNGGMFDSKAGTVFVGSTGTDYYSGGGANDQFVFHANFGKDTILNFNPGSASSSVHDVLTFDHAISGLSGITSDAALATYILSHTADTSGGALITIDAHNSVLLAHVAKANLNAHDFHLI